MLLGNPDVLLILILLVVGLAVFVGWLLWLAVRSRARAKGEGMPPKDTARSRDGEFLVALKQGPEGWEIYVQGQRYYALSAVPGQEVQVEVIQALDALSAFAEKSVGGHEAAVTRPSRPARPARPARPSHPVSTGVVGAVNLAEEIGEIVDELLTATPALENHAVHLQNAPEGGVWFVVDGAVYRELADIPNEGIKEIIRRATREWERR